MCDWGGGPNQLYNYVGEAAKYRQRKEGWEDETEEEEEEDDSRSEDSTER